MALACGESHQNLVLCVPCSESFNRWLAMSGRDGIRAPGRRKRSSEVHDKLVSHRRSGFSKRLDKFVSRSRKREMVWILCVSMLGVGTFGMVFALLWALGGATVARKR